MPKTWNDIEKNMKALTPEESAEIDLRVEIVSQIVMARKKSKLSQRGLSKESGIPQAVIARFERGNTDPRLMTMLRILRPLGYKLTIAPIEKEITDI